MAKKKTVDRGLRYQRKVGSIVFFFGVLEFYQHPPSLTAPRETAPTGLIRPKTSRSVVHCHPRSSSGSIFAIHPAKWGFSGLLSRLQPFPSSMLQRWRDDGAFCVDVPSNRRGGQSSSKGDFSERGKREGGRGVHTIAPWALGRFWQTIRRWKALRRVQKACAGMRGHPR